MQLIHSLVAASGLATISARLDLGETDQCRTVNLEKWTGSHEEIEVCDADINDPETMEEIMAAVDDEIELDPRSYKRRVMMMAADLITDNVPSPHGLEEYSRNKKRRVLYTRLSNYGCWCDPNNALLQARNGFAVDEIDQACKELFHCHKCLPIENGDSCSPEDGKGREYRHTYDVVDGINCQNPKNDNCGYNKCQCAKDFAEKVAAIWGSGDWEWNNAYWLNKKFVRRVLKNRPHPVEGNEKWFEKDNFMLFDYQFNCAVGERSPAKELACCGEFPNIKPYDLETRECCKAAFRPYEPNMQSCCQDGRVRDIGEC